MVEVVYILIGLIPSLLWLAYYLHRDNHPEPKRLVLMAFLVGVMLSLPAVGLEVLVLNVANSDIAPIATIISIGAIFWLLMSLIEEWLKFIGMKWSVLSHPHFRQPIDAMIFMIIVALGFAAAENTLFAFALGTAPDALPLAIEQGIVRGVSATLLHALASAVIGYFFARSLAFDHHHRWNLAIGLLTATVLHALYNFIIITSDGYGGTLPLLTTIVLLGGTAWLVSSMMRQLEQFPSFAAEHASEHDDAAPSS